MSTLGRICVGMVSAMVIAMALHFLYNIAKGEFEFVAIFVLFGGCIGWSIGEVLDRDGGKEGK